MKSLKKIVAGMSITAFVLGIMVVLPTGASAATKVGGTNNDLGDLFLLSALFNGQGAATPVAVPVQVSAGSATSTNQGVQTPIVAPVPYGYGTPGVSLGSLLVLDQIFSNGSGTSVKSTSANKNSTSLGDLLVLGQIFGGSGVRGGWGGGDGLGNLFVLDRLFSNNTGSLFSK